MLNESCHRFREDFDPEVSVETASHRNSCPDCDAWASTLETAISVTAEERPMPARLRARLRAIPMQSITCRETDRLYAAARRKAAGGNTDETAAEHLESCDHCAALYGTLRSVFSEKLPPAPRGLVERLKDIGRSPGQRLPIWIADTRYATAACILLTLLLSSFAGEAAAVLRGASETVSSHTAVWAEEGESRSRRMWNSTSGALQASYEKSREQLGSFAESCEELARGTIRDLGSLAKFATKENDDKKDSDDKEDNDGGKLDGKSESEPGR